MTPQALPFDAPAPTRRPRKPTLTDTMAAWWRARPMVWVDSAEQAAVAGIEGARTRRSECKLKLHMRFEKEVPQRKWPNGKARPRWRYVPEDRP